MKEWRYYSWMESYWNQDGSILPNLIPEPKPFNPETVMATATTHSMEQMEYHVFSTELNQGTHMEGMGDYSTFKPIILEPEIGNEASMERLRIT